MDVVWHASHGRKDQEVKRNKNKETQLDTNKHMDQYMDRLLPISDRVIVNFVIIYNLKNVQEVDKSLNGFEEPASMER